MQVSINGQEIRIEAPASPGRCLSVAHYAAQNATMAGCAALGLCWRGKGRPKATYEGCQYSPGLYAESVYDELVSRGLPASEILGAGIVALHLILSRVVPEAEVASAEDFSEPTPER